VIGKDVDWATVVAVETHQLDLPGVTLRARPRRSYADGQIGAHASVPGRDRPQTTEDRQRPGLRDRR
jgi:cell division protein FtsI/penicillin-binding protein 2